MEHIELLKRSIDYLVNDGRYDYDELCSLVELALEDGILTVDEKRVLTNIFATAKQLGVDPQTENLLEKLSLQYGIKID